MYNHRLTSVLTGATTAMIALVAIALSMSLKAGARFGDEITPQALLLLLVSTAATLLVMGNLHGKLQQMCSSLEEKGEQAMRAARTDSLTGLGNRAYLQEALCELAQANSSSLHVLLFLDLNNFKRINDTMGHASGDELIHEVGQRLRHLLPHASIARLGGDEFAILMDVEHREELPALCTSISAAIRERYIVGGQDTFVGSSIGAALVSAGADPSDMMRNADIAMYAAKGQGIPFRVFDDCMAREITRKLEIEQRLRTALASGRDLETQFQPVIAAKGGIVGLEALLRWRDPFLGAVSPREVLTVAEESNLADDVTLYVAAKACDAAIEFPDLTVAINLTAAQALAKDLAPRLASLYLGRGVDPSRIQLELTESAFVQRPAELSHALAALHEEGFQLVTDDFGTSNAALSHLRHAHISTVKIDRSFLLSTRIMGTIALMSASVHLAKLLGLKVVCEGVSDFEEQQIALETGCDFLQGFQFYTPMTLEELRLALQPQLLRVSA